MVMQKPNDLKRLTGLARPVSECLPKDIPPLLPQIAWYMPGNDNRFNICIPLALVNLVLVRVL